MKQIFLAIAFFGFIMIMSSCGEEELTGPGNIEVVVKKESNAGDLVSNARFSLATSQKKLNSGDYMVRDLRSGDDGVVFVKELEPKTYYYDCLYKQYGDDTTYYTEGTITVPPGQTAKTTIVLMPK